MPKVNGKYNKSKIFKKRSLWIIKIFILTFIIATVFSITSDAMVRGLNLVMALVTIIMIVLIGVVFDAIGIAVTAASKIPFLSMSSKKIRGANQAVYLIKNADQVSNFCNDVVGDICGIISGSAGGILFLRMVASGQTLNYPFLSIIISSFIAAFTVGGKALGKTLAINNSHHIVYGVGYLFSYFDFFKKNRK